MSIQKVKRILAMGLLACLVLAGQAYATPIVSISPGSQTVNVGDPVGVDILISNLGPTESVGGVSLFLSFTSSIIKGVSFQQDPDAKMGFALDPVNNDFGSSFTGAGGSPLEFFFLADASLNGAALKTLQGSAFRLAHVNFTAIAAGLSGLNLSVQPTQGIFISDADGQQLVTTFVNGSVCVTDPASTVPQNCQQAAVPEPATLALLGSGLTALIARRRRQKQQAPLA